MKRSKKFSGISAIGLVFVVTGLILLFILFALNIYQKWTYESKTLLTYCAFFIILGTILINPLRVIIKRRLECETVTNLLLSILVFIYLLFLIEIVSFFLILNNETPINTFFLFEQEKSFPFGYFYEYNDILGYHGRPNASLNESFTSRILPNSTIYNVTYTLDKFGRRITKEKGNNSHLILFGCSSAFGDGVENNETLANYLSEMTERQVYNYAFSGYGTQHMLAHLEREDFTNEISNKKGIAIYVFISHHIRRVIGDMEVYNAWGRTMPYYYLDKNEVRRKGSFATGRWLISSIYVLLGKSYFFKYFKINLPFPNEKHTYLTFKLIEKSKKIYESRFNGTFYVLIYPGGENAPFAKLLKENSINALMYDFPNITSYMIPENGHPSAEFNKILAERIAKDIKHWDSVK